MEIDSLRKLYVEELKDLYSAEKQLVQAPQLPAFALPKAKVGGAPPAPAPAKTAKVKPEPAPDAVVEENTAPARVEARLLFRAVPPYFLRALSSQQLPEEGERLETFVQNLEVLEMAQAKARVP